jgi:hypothetical protein
MLQKLKLVIAITQAYGFNLFVLATTALNTITGGDPGETLSSRLGKGKLSGKPVHTFMSRIVDAVFRTLFGQSDHCVESIQEDEGKGALSHVVDRHRSGEKKMWSL